ncbi:DNA-processing protein DprA [Alteribacillus bidgolensis]|uniref:DNA processing protein n=1 Tax=Alteribacillus bidgolensis TaxID=930129 RepID=A0A1G8GF12_9BACI|nr:DNA-processing protein DprA [Alteribacillus bidgolensis]SDH92936.1 DNA processing protein [Alteribacillus bidgolensis]
MEGWYTFTFTEKLLHLHEAPCIHWKRILAFYQADPAFELPYQMNPSDLSSFLRISPAQASLTYHYLHSCSPNEKLTMYQDKGIHILTSFDKCFPERLNYMYDPPWILYAKGDLRLLHSPLSLAVVGTRTPTEYGKNALHHLLPELIKSGVTIVSGLAKGTDAFSHNIAINKGGKTIAVLGSGFEHIYPRHHSRIASVIAEKHLLLSEYPPSIPPRKWQFPMRNRLISALSDITFISEAGERSGSLITAYQALEQGKDVRVLPGSIFSPSPKVPINY